LEIWGKDTRFYFHHAGKGDGQEVILKRKGLRLENVGGKRGRRGGDVMLCLGGKKSGGVRCKSQKSSEN